MAESNSQATRCPCGFFGSAQTLGLCSKCYNEREQNRAALLAVDTSRSSSPVSGRVVDRESTAFQTDSPPSTASQRGSVSELSSQNFPSDESFTTSLPITDINPADRDRAGDKTYTEHFPDARNIVAATDTATCSTPSCFSSSDTIRSTQNAKKRKLDCVDSDGTIPAGEVDDDEEEEERGRSEGGEPEAKKILVLPVQKNMKRCFTCHCRLPLAAREIGKCKCECVFCALHRLPEQHACAYDHKEQGRAEARTKMIVLRKHVGTSLKRLDAEDV